MSTKTTEFFVQHRDGSVSDAELHEPILEGGDTKGAKEGTRRYLLQLGFDEQRISVFLSDA